MAVYVDDIQKYNTNLKHKKWCHLLPGADIKELHAMAKKIGLRREWFQGKRFPHYDLTPSKRTLAIKNGAVETTTLKYMRERMRQLKGYINANI